jgi:hypothetical protein
MPPSPELVISSPKTSFRILGTMTSATKQIVIEAQTSAMNKPAYQGSKFSPKTRRVVEWLLMSVAEANISNDIQAFIVQSEAKLVHFKLTSWTIDHNRGNIDEYRRAVKQGQRLQAVPKWIDFANNGFGDHNVDE